MSLIAAVVWIASSTCRAAESEEADAPQPVGRVVRVESPIDDRTLAAVRNAVVSLQSDAEAGGREAILILDLKPGTSQFHNVLALTSFLTSRDAGNVRTVCWVEQPVDGYAAMVPLACRETVMHPDAEVGDFGRGNALPAEERTFVGQLAEKRRGAITPPAVAQAMADPGETLLLVEVEPAEGRIERRFLVRSGLELLRETGVVIRDTQIINEAGVPFSLSAGRAAKLGVLASSTAEGLDQVVDTYGLPPEAMRSGPAADENLVVRRIEVRDVIDPLLESFVANQIRAAVADRANLIIFEVESPGGYLDASLKLANQIADLESIEDRDIRTVAWIPREAISGAAIISLGCDEIILTPGGMIGDAGPIMMREGGAFEHAPEKIVSRLAPELANLAERKGRPPAVAMAMCDKSLAVYEVTHAKTGRTWYMSEDQIHDAAGEWVQGRRIPETRDDALFLTADGERAAQLKIASAPVADFEELRSRLGIPADTRIKTVQRTWIDNLVFILNTPMVTTLLFFVGILCIYLELHLMTGLLSIGAVMCFGLFFWSRSFGGTAGGLGFLLFLLGLVFLALEIFVVPGFGVFGVTGILLMVGSLVIASMTFDGFSSETSLADTGKALGQITIAIAGVVLVGSVAGKFLPRIPMFSSMVLAPPGVEAFGDAELQLRPDLIEPAAAGVALVGMSGTAETTLRPAGKALFDGRYLDVVSDGPFVPAGMPVEVVRVEGNRVVVKPVAIS